MHWSYQTATSFRTDGKPVYLQVGSSANGVHIVYSIIAVLDTMSKRDQLDLLPKVAAAFKYVAEEDEDVVGVTVTTAIPLDDELRQTITKKCEQDFGRKVFLIEQVDPSIVGGLVLEARGERRDISVKTQLRIAQETLANSANSYGGEA